jgi:hypothetical protein
VTGGRGGDFDTGTTPTGTPPTTTGIGTTPPGQAPHYPSPTNIQEALQTWRQPIIDQLKAQHPTWTEGQLWAAYTLTPYYQQEQALQLNWTRPPPEGH